MLDPWIILMIDRRRLGAPVYALARPRRRDRRDRIRRTLRVERALAYPTERKATNAARKLLDRGPGQTLFVVARVTDGDLARPRPEPAGLAQSTFLPETDPS